MEELEELYFKDDGEFREWLHKNHAASDGIYLIFYKVDHDMPSMRWEEAVRVALCYGWIDSTVKSLGNGKRRQYFCPRNAKSVWSRVNKNHLKELEAAELIHESGYKAIEIAKKNGSWTELDDVENGVIPEKLQQAFDKNQKAFKNYQKLTRGQRKSYLYWLNNAKRETTREKRIKEIIALCEQGKKLQNR